MIQPDPHSDEKQELKKCHLVRGTSTLFDINSICRQWIVTGTKWCLSNHTGRVPRAVDGAYRLDLKRVINTQRTLIPVLKMGILSIRRCTYLHQEWQYLLGGTTPPKPSPASIAF